MAWVFTTGYMLWMLENVPEWNENESHYSLRWPRGLDEWTMDMWDLREICNYVYSILNDYVNEYEKCFQMA